jgi:predicted  nucleic acid-binding Zn-ribbon protein
MNREFLESLGLEKEAIDKVMAEHGKAVQAVKPAEGHEQLKEELATLQKQLDDANSTLESERTTLQEQIQALEKESNTYKTNDMKLRIALENNIPYELANKLSGEDEESLRQDAQTLANYIAKPETIAPLKDVEPPIVDSETESYKNILNNLKLEGE